MPGGSPERRDGPASDGGHRRQSLRIASRQDHAMIHDFCVIGGGIVGLATARQLLLERPGAGVAGLEKEAAPGLHQTGHNSGVIHAGVYYKPGSLKATLCKAGAVATREFCEEHAIAYETRGKLIVATDAAELERMQHLGAN